MKKNKLLLKLAALLFFVLLSQTVLLAQLNYWWHINGNKGTNPSTNYLGTRDNTDFVIRTNAKQRMYIKANGNIGIGTNNPVQMLDVTGNVNIGSGYGLYMGGSKILSTPGTGNLYIGYLTAENNGGYQCTIIGTDAGLKNSGSNNTFCGHESGISNTIGTYNTFYGLATGYNNTTGDGNSAFGQNVIWSNVSGSWNCSFGFEAGNYTTTSNNCFFGAHAGLANKTGSKNTYIGYSADANGANYSNSSSFGYTAQVTASNQIRLGNSSVTSIGGFVDWSNISDGRFKKDIKANVPGLDFIKQLQPVTYTLDIGGIDAYLHKDQVVDMKGKLYTASNEDINTIKEKEKIIYTGFVAQDVEKAAKKLGFDFSGVDAPKNNKDLYGLRYAEFVVPLVKAVQELASQNDELKNQLADLQNQINQLKSNGTSSLNASSADLNNTVLEQNIPNPFSQSTDIKYYIPASVKQAQLIITGANGNTLKSQTVIPGHGKITIKASELTSGTYIYTLYADGKIVDSKKMVLTK